MFLLSRIEIFVYLNRLVRRYAINDCRFGQRMYGQTPSLCNASLFKQQGCSTMSDHDLPFLSEILKHLQHLYIIRFRAMFLKYRYGIAT